MSLYGNQVKIGGVLCGLVLRSGDNGKYQAIFEREFASLEDIEGIDWDRPAIEGDCILPAGYGFTVEDIGYSSTTQCYAVTLRTATQYLGDVTGYQAQVEQLTKTVTEQSAIIQTQAGTIAALESQTDGGDVLEQLTAAYLEGVEGNG